MPHDEFRTDDRKARPTTLHRSAGRSTIRRQTSPKDWVDDGHRSCCRFKLFAPLSIRTNQLFFVAGDIWVGRRWALVLPISTPFFDMLSAKADQKTQKKRM